jgi:hypothetical protein
MHLKRGNCVTGLTGRQSHGLRTIGQITQDTVGLSFGFAKRLEITDATL